MENNRNLMISYFHSEYPYYLVFGNNNYILKYIPISFSTLTPLIISKETNSYYQFKNVVEFVKESDEPIILHSIDIESLERERNELIDKNHALFDSMINQ